MLKSKREGTELGPEKLNAWGLPGHQAFDADSQSQENATDGANSETGNQAQKNNVLKREILGPEMEKK